MNRKFNGAPLYPFVEGGGMNQPNGSSDARSHPSGSKSPENTNNTPKPHTQDSATPYNPEAAYFALGNYTTVRVQDARNIGTNDGMPWNYDCTSDQAISGVRLMDVCDDWLNTPTDQLAVPRSNGSSSWQVDASNRAVEQYSPATSSAGILEPGQSSPPAGNTNSAGTTGVELTRVSSHQPTSSSSQRNVVQIPRSHSSPAISPQRFQCDLCDVTCSREAGVVRHMGTAHGIVDVWYRCKHLSCDFYDSRPDKAKEHHRNTGHEWLEIKIDTAAGT